ncbi:hypothetical protein [Saccharopolyspora pogona]|uniref:hypothetical protein n=1 Tax=Saccharopolyspora pogona TaxID=333966 RepID=UPI001684C447|nr:hypothetical protein [Saccharopolyspora pogona]
MTKQLFKYEIELLSYEPSGAGSLFGMQVDRFENFTAISGGFRFRAWSLVIEKKEEGK